jgi:hypothetical protein
MHQPLERRATMRKVILSLAAAAATLAVAAPASAQAWGNMTPSRGYAAPGYGYANYNRANVRALQVRVDAIQRQISNLARYRMITHNEYNNLIRDSREVERAIHQNARDGRGLSPREFNRMQQKIARLEYKVQRDARDGRQWRYRW